MSELQEQQTEKKRAGIVKRVLKWFGLGLLTLLFIASVIFEGPWKVTTLLMILIAGSVLPKPYGKYFWLCVGVVVIVLIVWVFLPEETEGWRPYTFDKELAAIEAERAIPDSENAAAIYNQLLEDYNDADFKPNFADPNLKNIIRKEFWLSEDYPEAAEWIGQHEKAITKLIEAAKIKQCRFPIKADVISLGDTTERLGSMRRWALLLISTANNDIAKGRTEDGLEKYIAALQIGKHICQQPSMTDFLTGIGTEALSTSQLKRFVVTDNVTDEQLNLIERAVSGIKHDWSYDLPRIIDYEKLFLKNFWGMFYAVNAEGRVILNPFIAVKEMMAQVPEDVRENFVMTYWRERRMKASIILPWFYMPSTPQKAGQIIDSEYERLYAMAEPGFDWQKGPEKPSKMFKLNYRYVVEYLAGIVEPTYYSIHNSYLQNIAGQRGALLTIALRRYKNRTGNWPGSLDEVKSLAAEEIFVDPVNGGSFVYKLTDDNFTLYSKGKNNIDDDGQYDSKWDPNSCKVKTEKDDRLIWPAYRQKSKSEKEKINNTM